MKLGEVGHILQVSCSKPDVDVYRFSTDSRRVNVGDLFIAFSGDNHNGHDFIESAISKGAVAIIAERDIEVGVPVLKVKNARLAYAKLAKAHCAKMNVKKIAVTGSCGKTSTRAFLEGIFSEAGLTHASIESFNNDIGVPYTVLQLTPEHEYLVSELGANHAGEISFLTDIVQPDIAIITNIAPAHLEGFKSIDGVAHAKSEIFEGLSSNGVAVLNADNEYFSFLKKQARPHRVVSFGIEEEAEVCASNIVFNEKGHASFLLTLPGEVIDIMLGVVGLHNVSNALAAAAAGFAAGLSIKQIKSGLEKAKPVTKRLVEKHAKCGAVVIDDSYNANPLSVSAAIEALAQYKGKKIFVLGDMLELGENENEMHRALGVMARQKGINLFYGYGIRTLNAVEAYGDDGYHFSDRDALAAAIEKNLDKHTTVLIKGSNSMGMDKVVQALVGDA